MTDRERYSGLIYRFFGLGYRPERLGLYCLAHRQTTVDADGLDAERRIASKDSKENPEEAPMDFEMSAAG